MRPRGLRHAALGDVRDIVIEELVQRHHPPDRAHRDIRPGQQAPDPELPRIRMGLLQVIDLHHQGQPHLADGGFGRAAAVHQPGEVLRLEALDPRIDRGPRHVQEATDTDLIPPAIIELDDLQPRLIAVGLRVVVPQRQVPLTGHRTRLPECLDRLVVDRRAKGDEQDAGEFPVVEAVIEGLEAIDLLAHGLRDGAGPPPGHHLDIGGEESRHALLPETAPEGADRVGVGVGFLRPLLGRPIGKQHQGADQLVAPLGLIDEAQLQLRKLRGRFHRCPPPVVGLRGLCSTPDRGCHP